MRCTLLLIFLLVSCLGDYQWTINNLSASRLNMASAGTNGYVFFAGGWDGTPSNAIDIYNTRTQSWIVARLDQSRDSVSGTNVKNLVVFAGGLDQNDNPVDTFELFDTENNNQKTIGRLSKPISSAAATRIRDLALFVGGSNITTVEAFNATSKTWKTNMRISQARKSLAAASNGDWAFFGGGIDFSGVSQRTVDIFYVGDSSWTTDQLSQPRHLLSATSVHNLVLFAGGFNSFTNSETAVVDFYNLTNNQKSVQQLSVARYWGTASTLGSLALIAGGYSGEQASRVLDIYNVITNTWSTDILANDMPESASVVLGNQIFFASSGKVNAYALPINSTYLLPYSETSSFAPVQAGNQDSDKNIPIIAGSVGGFVVLVIVAVLVAIFIVRRRRNQKENQITNLNADVPMSEYSSMPQLMKPYNDISPEEVILGDQLGVGSAGVVYKGDWRGTPVAVKKLKVDQVKPEWLETFRLECGLMKDMKPHPNVLQFFGVIQNPLSIVVEYCPRGSLRDLLDDKSFKIETRMSISLLRGIANGMKHLSDQKIVHRDLATRNVLLRDDFTAVVSDFGMSRTHNQEGEYFASTAHHGWPIKWMAPETFDSHVFSERTDVFSFGVVCVEILTRDVPYPDYTIERFSIRVIADDLVSQLPNYVPKNAPQFLQTLVRQCVSKDPLVRPTFKIISKIFENV